MSKRSERSGRWQRAPGAAALGLFNCALAWILVTSGSTPLSAQEYVASVRAAFGVHKASFPEGEIAVLSYTLDPLVADSNADPQVGVFQDAVTSLSVSFANLDVSAFAGPAGVAQTFDNAEINPPGTLSDQVFIFGGPILESSLLAGEEINFLELDFRATVMSPAEPMLISNDSLPASKLGYEPGGMILSIGTGDGEFTSVFLEPSCLPDPTTLCLNNDRFRVEVEWQSSTESGQGQVVPGGTDDSSNLWFFSSNNWEMLAKVLDGCAINNHYWVFFAATTDVGFTMTVTDTQEGEVKTYTNSLGQAADAVTDTSAFATCP